MVKVTYFLIHLLFLSLLKEECQFIVSYIVYLYIYIYCLPQINLIVNYDSVEFFEKFKQSYSKIQTLNKLRILINSHKKKKNQYC